MEERPQMQEIQIEVPEKEGEGIYSNFAIVSHSPTEFVIDFTRIMPGLKKTKIYARIILAPAHAKRLLKTLEENIKKYEERFGEIKIEETHEKKIIGFKPE